MQVKQTLRFKNTVLFVRDAAVSKRFYKMILGQEVLEDFNRYVGFKGGFGIWQGEYALELIRGKVESRERYGADNCELYFETDDLDAMLRYLEGEDVPFIHPVMEHDWGQRGFRIADPDGHIIEISEPMETVVRRLASDGVPVVSIAQKTQFSEDDVKRILRESHYFK